MATVQELDEELKKRGFYLLEDNGSVDSILFSMNFISLSKAKEILHNANDPKEIQVMNMIKFLANNYKRV